MEVENKTLFGKYQIGRLLGKGTFGRVNYGKEIATGESVAIKVINKSKVKKEGMVDQIQREISVMHLVRHPNIVDLREVLATKTKIFFVMEYARGGELFAKVVKGRLSEELARKYFQQLISAVAFCHSCGVSHRDLKPENLLLDENENLKVSDFGLSALPEQLWNDGLLHTQCGTPSYVAPEILRKKGYDGSKADIWSCGIILYALLAGYLPFQHENLIYLYTKLLKAEFEFPPWFSLESRTLISNILVPDPHTRISISSIMSAPWFLDGFSSTSTCSSPHHQPWENKLASRVHHPLSSSSPKFFNAFEFISTMSSGFDLSGLFEDKRRTSSIFTSKCSPSVILSKIDSMAKDLRFKIEKGKDSQVRLQAPSEGRSGRLLVAAEVFKVAEEVAVVEFSKCSGDTLEYEKLCEEQIRPALKDIVWTWQGEYCEEFSKSS